MRIIKDVPFYKNTSDNTHCFQAGLKMILKFFIPNRDFSFEELDVISEKKEGLWTWSMAALIWMQKNDFEVVNIEIFDYNKFIDKGEKYLIEEFGKETAEIQIKKSDIEKERKSSKVFLEKIKTIKIIPKKQDISNLMNEGYVIVVSLNSRILDDEQGYASHFVIIKGYDDNNFILNDPGLPGIENRTVSFDIFKKAWAYPNERAKNITAFKLKNNPS